jgi:hypothetical protein
VRGGIVLTGDNGGVELWDNSKGSPASSSTMPGPLPNACRGGRETIEYEVVRKGQCMTKSRDTKRDVKKKPQRTLKEKRLAKKMKKAGLSA